MVGLRYGIRCVIHVTMTTTTNLHRAMIRRPRSGFHSVARVCYQLTLHRWCTEEIIENNGLLSVNIPSDLASGPWLVRTELLALQSAEINDPQFYIGCAQIFYTSTGTSLPADTISIPGYVKAGDASVSFNVYQPTWPYTIPGPAAYKSGSSSARLVKDSALVQKLGLPPANCILENCNWCGVEVTDYTTEAGCYAVSDQHLLTKHTHTRSYLMKRSIS